MKSGYKSAQRRPTQTFLKKYAPLGGNIEHKKLEVKLG
jgi:hypothetical protein